MIIKHINIQNFMSIGNVDIDLTTTGITEVIGKNMDSLDKLTGLPSSNGTGKSAITLAIYQGLYNTNPKVKRLDLLKNSFTKKHYKITIEVINNGSQYVVVNNRAHETPYITVSKDGVVQTSRINESLKYIATEVIGLQYQEFLSLTFISNRNVLDIFSTTSTKMLTNFFNFNQLEKYKKVLSKKKIELNATITTLQQSVQQVGVSVTHESLEDLERTVDGLQTQMHDISTELSKHRAKKHVLLDMHNYQKITEANVAKVCSTCNQPLVTDIPTTLDIVMLRQELENIDILESQLNTLDVQLRKTTYKISSHNRVAKVLKVNTDKVLEDIKELSVKLRHVTTALKVIRDGVVQTQALTTFAKVLNLNLKSINKTSHIITPKLLNGNIIYDVEVNGVLKDVTTLSSGEVTSLGLYVMVAMFKTLEDMLGVTVNLLVLDEAIQAVDRSNMHDIELLLTSLKHTKSILLTQHRDEISSDVINSTLTLDKVNGVTYAT